MPKGCRQRYDSTKVRSWELTRLTTKPPRECARKTIGRSVAFRIYTSISLHMIHSWRLKCRQQSITYPSVREQVCNQTLCMVVDFVLCSSFTSKGGNVRIVSVYKYTHLLLFHELRQELRGPEDVRGLTGPCIVRVTIQTMNQDQIDEGRAGGGGRVSFCQTITLDGDWWRALLRSASVIDQPALAGEGQTYHHLGSLLIA